MKSVFIKEQLAYSKSELVKIFGSDNANSCIKKLKEYGILKTIRKEKLHSDWTELDDADTVVVDEEDSETERYYVFTFVGVIIVNGYVLKCYPKYIHHGREPFEELKQVLNVLEKYNTKEQIIKMYINNHNNSRFNRLAAIMFLLNDYYENGVYNRSQNVIETNGTGEINWDKTINETFAIFKDQRPYYTALQTRKHKNDELDDIKRLHECILTICSNELKEASLLDLLGLTEVNLSSETLDSFGHRDSILYRIEKEMNIQFNTRKLSLLKMLHLFVSNEGAVTDNSCFSLYGTTSFYTVWEQVCSDVIENHLNTKLKDLALPKPLSKRYSGDTRLIEIIDKPVWVDSENGEHQAKQTLKPDLISLQGDCFIIFDAKYYNLVLEKGKALYGQPGVGDVTKQYLYQLAYKDFLSEHGFNTVKNCFLLPTEADTVIHKGAAKFNILSKLGLEDIQIRQLPAKIIYNMYLYHEKLDISKLALS